MLSIRNGVKNIPYLAGKYLSRPAKHFMNVFAILLLLLVGVVFVMSPASLLTNITSDLMSSGSVGVATVNDEAGASAGTILTVWTTIIFVYYIIATLVPIDKIIGRIYPFFGALLMFMTLGMLFGLLFSGSRFFRTIGTDIGF